jgi:hypothetical protein
MSIKLGSKPLSICILGKFFPTQGGMASSVYWQAEALSGKNVDVTVISNGALVEDEYKIKHAQSKNFPFNTHYIDNLNEHYIPNREQDIASLVEKILSSDKKFDIIDAQYLLPFGIVAYFVHLITGIPYIIRHGGSDIDKFLNKGTFLCLFTRVLKNAACVITDDVNVKKVARNVKYIVPYIPDHRKFKIIPRDIHNKINIAYIGKINVLWQYKSLGKILDLFRNIKNQIDFTFLSQGGGTENLKNSVSMDYVRLKDFIPPWEMPDFYSKLDYIVFFCNNNPLPDWPCILLEAISSGVKILTDSPSFFKNFSSLIKNIDEFIIPIKNDITKEELLHQLRTNRGTIKPIYKFKYDDCINENISLYDKVMSTNKSKKNKCAE